MTGNEPAELAANDVLDSDDAVAPRRLVRRFAGLSPRVRVAIAGLGVLVVAAGAVAVRAAVSGSGVPVLADRCPAVYKHGPVSGVSCADGVFLLRMAVPVAVQVPSQWLLTVRLPGSDEATLLPPDMTPGLGVWIYEDVVALNPGGAAQPTADPSAGSTARSLATWLAARPGLGPTPVVATRVAGLPAYQVDLTPATGNPDTASDQPTTRYATFALASDPTAIIWESAGVRVRYTLLDLPPGGLLVVRTLPADRSQAATTQAILTRMRIG